MSYGSIYLNSWIGNPSTGLQGSVTTFNDLPQPPSEYMGKYYRVVEGSGGLVIAGYRIGGNDPGVYYSNGTTWSVRRDLDATDIIIDNNQYTIITSATNLRDGLKELDLAVVANVGNPTGTTIAWTGSSSSIPAGYLHCNGQSVSRTTYSALFTHLGTVFGSVDANTFNVPNYRDMFLRGASDTRAVNTYQEDEFKEHKHPLYHPNESDQTQGFPSTGFKAVWSTDRDVAFGSDAMKLTGGSETRPKNMSVHYLIKT